jgi:hypothetical protein
MLAEYRDVGHWSGRLTQKGVLGLMTAKREYVGKGGDEFGRFDKVMRGLLAVPYEELQKELSKERKKKERRKKRVKKPASRVTDDR